MSEEETIKITKFQRELLMEHLCDMNTRAMDIVEETSYLMANFKVIKIILDDTEKINAENPREVSPKDVII